MIVFAVQANSSAELNSQARTSVEKNFPHAKLEICPAGSPAVVYNQVIEAYKDNEDVDLLVFLKDGVSVEKCDLGALVEECFSHYENLALFGPVGATNVEGIDWWNGHIRGSVQDRNGLTGAKPEICEVDALDGLFLGMTKEGMKNLKFDEKNYPGEYGWDIDICFTGKSQGLISATIPVQCTHHNEGAAVNREQFSLAGKKWADKWGSDLSYYSMVNPAIIRNLPEDSRKILDVGCGAGALGAYIKKIRPTASVDGMEVIAAAAQKARSVLDDVYEIDLDTFSELPKNLPTYDTIIFGDVLEHLRDPEKTLRVLLDALEPGGVVVASIPNVKHWSVVLPLIANDDFTYTDAGLLDRTHIHLFTLKESLKMFDAVGLENILKCEPVSLPNPNPEVLKPLLDCARSYGAHDVNVTQELFNAYQYLFVAKKKQDQLLA